MLTKATYLLAYNHSIGPCVGEKHWPEKDMPLAPPEIKAMPSSPKKNIRRSAHEDPKKPGRLTKDGVKMTCSLCKSPEHTRKKCPEKNNHSPPPLKKKYNQPPAQPTRKNNQPPPPSKRQKSSSSKATSTSAPAAVGNMVAVEARKGKGRAVDVRGGNGEGVTVSGAMGRGNGVRARGRGMKPNVPIGACLYVDTLSGQSFLNAKRV